MTTTHRAATKGYALVAAVYLLGLFIGALDTGIVTPARTVIQNTMGVEDQLGVWMITIYTLSYAAAIPIMGNFADKFGRKHIYLICVLFFGVGSFICGFSQNIDNFYLLLAGRVIQAIGGGGIVPVATAEFGTAFPEEKRGMALGLVGGVYGVANVFGSSAGSAILDVFGQANWQYIFYINVPICIFILVVGTIKMQNNRAHDVKPIDWPGIIILTTMVLSLMYGLKNLDFFALPGSLLEMDVAPFIAIFFVLLPFLIFFEKRAADAVLNLDYFKDKEIVLTLLCALCTGVILMANIFTPQFAENNLMMRSGAGGYMIIILGFAAGFGSMASGGLIDKYGVKPVLGFGFIASALGSLYMSFICAADPSLLHVVIGFIIFGLGMGFTMGTPLNYMMLQRVPDEESNSALATLSLLRSFGTAVAPAIMVAFVATAGANMQDRLMDTMPNEVTVSPLPYAQELDEKLLNIQNDPDTADMLSGIDIPNLSSYTTISIDMNAEDSDFNVEISPEMEQELKDSDVTTIVPLTKKLATEVFGQVKPDLIADVQDGIDSGISGMGDGLSEMNSGLSEMNQAISEMNSGIEELSSQISKMDEGITGLSTGISQLSEAIKQKEEILGEDHPAVIAMKEELSKMQAQRSEMQSGRSEMANALAQMKTARGEIIAGRAELLTAHADLADTINKLKVVREAIPGVFDEAEEKYLIEIDNAGPQIQEMYQETLNEGFSNMFNFVVGCCVVGFIMLLFYKDNRKPKESKAGHGHGHGRKVKTEAN